MKYHKVYTFIRITIEIVSLLILIATAVNLFINWDSIPEFIPYHYSAKGVSSWRQKYELIALPILSAGFFLLISAIEFVPDIWNIPGKVTGLFKEKIYHDIIYMLILIKLEIILFFYYITQDLIEARSLPINLILTKAGIILATIIFFSVRIAIKHRLFRNEVTI